jgi:endonuclease I
VKLYISVMRRIFSITSLFTLAIVASAQPPAGYYDLAQGKAGNALRVALRQIIRGHHVITYATSSVTNVVTTLDVLDEDPANTNNVILIYSQSSDAKTNYNITADGWNREHLWCDSYGLDGVQPAYSDLFNLRPIDSNVNSSRGNKFYDISDPLDPDYRNPAFPEAPLCSSDSDSWEPPDEVKGDIARSLFYMDVRYEGDTNNELNLVLTDNTPLIDATNAYMGKLSTLLQWNDADPVSTNEEVRVDKIFSLFQHNRNPFVDHPEWVNLIFSPAYTNPPLLKIAILTNGIALNWLATNQSSQLESTTNITGNWISVTNTPVLTNSSFCVVLSNSADRMFFRLSVQ